MRFIIHLFFHIGFIELFSAFLLFINFFTFLLYVIDKRKAVKKKWRISESVLIFFTLAFGGLGALAGMRLMEHKTKKMKFILAVAIGFFIAHIPIIHITHSLTLDKIIRYREIEFRSENWPYALDGYRIAFMTDMHTISEEEMKKTTLALNKKNIDLLLLGGDFSMRNDHFKGTVKEISGVTTTDGVFGVEGNHDNYIRLFKEMEQYGMTPLNNNGIHISNGFYLAGVQDKWNRNPDIKQSIANASGDDFILLVSHNPDVTMVQPTDGIDLILSGHTHNGQITLFGYALYLWRGSITDYHTRFAYGFAESADGVPVFVSRGVGPYYEIPRVFSRPEVVIFTMFNE